MADEEFMRGDLLATVRVQDLPASREVVAVERQESGAWRVCGSATANADGIADLSISGSKTSRVYAFAIDHWGEPFTPNKTVAYGDIIRPSVFLGWLYRVTAPGVLPSEEPVWWNSTPGMPRPVGSAMAQAEMYFQPIAHGPVDIEWEEKAVGDPHWDKVVSLLHFDGDVVDQIASNAWVPHGVYFNPNGVFSSAITFDSTNNSSRLALANKPSLRLSDSDFTIEMWVQRFPGSFREVHFFSLYGYSNNRRSYNLCLRDDSNTLDKGLIFRVSPDGYSPAASGGSLFRIPYREALSLLPENAWRHIAVCRKGSDFFLFIQGSLVATDSFSSAFYENTVDDFLVGSVGPNYVNPWQGLIDELRITKGVARYTENFTPPTEPFPNFK